MIHAARAVVSDGRGGQSPHVLSVGAVSSASVSLATNSVEGLSCRARAANRNWRVIERLGPKWRGDATLGDQAYEAGMFPTERDELGDRQVALGHDESLPLADTSEIGAEVLAKLADSNGLIHVPKGYTNDTQDLTEYLVSLGGGVITRMTSPPSAPCRDRAQIMASKPWRKRPCPVERKRNLAARPSRSRRSFL
jgi:hypothetical protein